MSELNWRSTDLEAIRVALAIPVSPNAVQAINDAMAALELSYPDAIPAAKAHLDAIALIDNPPPGAAAPSPPEPVVQKVTRKGAAGPVPEQLPEKKLDVIEFATELLLEETSTEYWIPAQQPAPAPDPRAQRRHHAQQLLLILPALERWVRRPTFSGQMIRG